jgi:hypothetical protein
MTQMKKTAGYLIVCAFTASVWIGATGIGPGDSNAMEATPAATGESASVDIRFVEPTTVEYGPHLESR